MVGVFLLATSANLTSALADTVAPVRSTPSFADTGTLAAFFWGAGNALDASYDRVQQWKADNHIPISFGAQHWWHIDAGDHLYGNGYGLPGLRGTYYYFVAFDPSMKVEGNGIVDEIGFHNQTRFRDSGDKLRSFYNDTIWTYETYAYAKTSVGRFKAGQIVQEFGIPWDNSWWEAVPFFDGYRSNPAWGFSWDRNWNVSNKFSVASTLQYFIIDDRVSGAFADANAEASPPLSERNTFNVRLVPQWTLNDDTKIKLGLSALTREIDHAGFPNVDSRQTAFAVDLTYTWNNLSVYGQYTNSHGAITPARYVSGGPSDKQESVEVGFNYTLGPVSARVNYSEGWDDNPSGHQYIFNPGLTFQISKGVTAYAEYVKWNVTDSTGTTTRFDDGYELILVWNY
ncbi:MAG: hypothetical protein R3D51_16955 [Hyphomicrobiaceae bacterium]